MALNRLLLDSAGNAINDSRAATFQSETLDHEIYGEDIFGLCVDVSAVTGTLDPKLEVSFDGGSTWLVAFPADINSDTQAQLTQMSGAAEQWKYWTIPFGYVADPATGDYPVVRVNFVIATGPSVFTSARITARRFTD